MAFKIIKASSLVIAALFSNDYSQNLVNASYSKVGEGLVRIDLEKKYIAHQDTLQLSDTVDVDKMLLIDQSGNALNDENLLLDLEETSYSKLRAYQKSHINKFLRQQDSLNLAQNDQRADNQGRAHVKTKQLLSETAESSIDNRDDLKLQVPLNSRNDAVYLGTVYMGSPVS